MVTKNLLKMPISGQILINLEIYQHFAGPPKWVVGSITWHLHESLNNLLLGKMQSRNELLINGCDEWVGLG